MGLGHLTLSSGKPTRTHGLVPPGSAMSTAGRRSPAVGMTPAEVLASSWGEPSGKRTSSTANGSTEVWTYAGKRTIYFFKGRVSNITQ